MLATQYKQLNPQQKTLVTHKIAMQTKCPELLIKSILYKMNPPVEVTNGNVSLFKNTLMRIQKEIKNHS